MSSKLRFVAVLAVCCLVMIRLVHPVQAAGTVTNCASFGGAGSLQNALAGGGLITFTCSGTIQVPQIYITRATTLDATGQSVILEGDNTHLIFYATAPLVLEHLTVRNGNAGGIDGGAVSGYSTTQINNSTIADSTALVGGGIMNGGTGIMTITNSTISGNTAVNGAGIYNSGELTIVDSLISGNNALNGGAGIYSNTLGKLIIRNTTISNNTAAMGAGLFMGLNYSSAEIRLSSFSNNLATNDGSAIMQDGTNVTTNIVCSNITGNGGGATYSTVKQSGLDFIARKNWWGNASGPGGVGPGSGDTVGSGVDFADFLAAPATLTDCPIPVVVTPVATQPPSESQKVAETVPLCADLDGTTNPVVRVSLPVGAYGVYCRIIAENRVFTRSPAEVGVQSVLDRGVIHAVDIFSPSNASAAGVLICLQGDGDLIFLDAAGAPRVAQPLTVQAWDGFSCTTIPNVGTVVLVDKQ